jgi:hypothetical protein
LWLTCPLFHGCLISQQGSRAPIALDGVIQWLGPNNPPAHRNGAHLDRRELGQSTVSDILFSTLYFGHQIHDSSGHQIHDSSVWIVTWLRAGTPGFDFRQGQGFFFLFTIAAKPAVGLTQPLIRRVQGTK